MNNNIPTIRQGASLGITITLDEDLGNREFYLGFYPQNVLDRTASILVSTKDNLYKIGDKLYHANIEHEKTKNLGVGIYRIEALIKDLDSKLISISNRDITIKVAPSNIGREV